MEGRKKCFPNVTKQTREGKEREGRLIIIVVVIMMLHVPSPGVRSAGPS